MQLLWPTTPAEPVSDADLERLYGYPEDLNRPWVQVNFVSSADGAAAVDELSEGLSHPADKRIFVLGRLLSDVILVGAGTARAEGYRGARVSPERAGRRAALGLSEVPPIAVVTRSGELDPEGPLFTDTKVPPIVITTEQAPRAELERAGADVLVAGTTDVDLRRALALLDERGLRRVDCEGGPALFADLIAADLVDQLCLTVAPLLAGAGESRIVRGRPAPEPRRMDLASVLVEDGFTMLRYRRREGG
ncbi:Pyrimidine reductase, riboflavin biosynthesis [Amycolatopsis lurida]|uniref:5-amino-6-(5-phosphoribosylamino)uracil reductase n=1 Tax=Amycolatopsis lurida NRRL 2430 TaxID=1460371 RepID=A0A2P2FLB9_AMYLU|nr:pyrimidine reductase family protein [Amycolatopsis lurida]KFU77520.1 5-amino-6-(5-phosphoribosylamino)uracil reductase [Amycolatopsis lurida NRRL 2430]SEC66299.1 Pyrimidine reductase, riboflavin biosynthesis [Amycolatopsis lurida]